MNSPIPRRRVRASWCVAFAALVALPAPAFAQTTGRLVGSVEDAQGGVLPSVTVTVTSPQLQGASTAITDATGQYRFPALPPGPYHVKAELAGFKTAENDVRVGIDTTVTLGLRLAVAGVAESVTVVGQSMVVDTTSTTGGISAGAEVFNNLPIARDFYGITKLAPGVTQDTYGASINGSTSAENQYIIDGLNTTGVNTGTEGKTLNFDFVQEVEVKTGGLSAEYGRLTGGAVNVLTKSGGNTFHGDVFGFGEGGGLQAGNSTASKLPQTATTTLNTAHRADYGVDLGGYIVKDKVWFFGAFDRVDQRDEATILRALAAPGSPAVGSTVPSDISKNLFAAKITLRPSQSHTIVGTVFGDPNKREGAIFTTANGQQFLINGPASTWQGTLEQGSVDSIGRYEGVYGSATLLSVSVGQHREKTTYSGAGASTPQFLDQTVTPTQTSGGFGVYDNQNFKRNVVKGDLTKYWGSHTIKAGGDFENITAVVDRFQGGAGQRIYKFVQASTGIVYYRHRYYVDDQKSGFSRTDPTTWSILNPLEATPKTQNHSFYAQDSYKVLSNLSINYGVRWERQHVLGRDADAGFALNKNWAPRIGVVWDPTNTGKAKVYGNFGRFYENIPQDINIRAFGGETQAFAYNFSPNAGNTTPLNTTPSKSSLLGGSAEPVDPDLKGQYINEWIGGFEYEVMPETTIGARVTFRKLGRVIEDFLVPSSGQYFIANPGEGTLGQSLGFYDGVSTAPAPAAQRKNTSVELTFRKRHSNNWQFLGSYVFSKLEGNYDGTFQNSTGQLDPNINSAFDYADFMVNAFGELTNQHKHQVKGDASYVVSGGALNGLNVGGAFRWYSGLPSTAYGYSFAYSNWEYYLTPRGALGYGPSDYELDLHVGYPFKLGGTAKANLLLDVFNVLNRQGSTIADQRYNLQKNGPCGGVPEAICNGDGGLIASPGTVNAKTQLSNVIGTATNPDFLKAGTQFTLPRSLRIGVRLTF
jgi:hypothetical protein